MTVDAEPISEVKPVTLQLKVRPDTRTTIEKWRDKKGVPSTELAARIVNFFSAQPAPVQDAIIEGEDVAGAMTGIRLTDLLTLQGSVEKLPDLTPIQIAQMQTVLAQRLTILLKAEASIPPHVRRKGTDKP